MWLPTVFNFVFLNYFSQPAQLSAYFAHNILQVWIQLMYNRTEFTEYRSFGSVGSRNTEPNFLMKLEVLEQI